VNAFFAEAQELFAVGGWVLIALLLLGFGIAWNLFGLWQHTAWLAGREGSSREDQEARYRLRRRFDFAFILIGVAPLVGLLGTVSGMFATFDGMAAGSAAPLGAVSRGVSEALITTQAGLIIAVPAFIACTLLRSRANRLEGEIL